MELLVDMEKYNHLFEFTMANKELSKKHILQLNISESDRETFKSNVLSGIIKLLFREGTPFYVTQRQSQSTRQSTGQNISHIMGHTQLTELMNALKFPKPKRGEVDKFKEFLKQKNEYLFRANKSSLRGYKIELKEHEKKLLTMDKLENLRLITNKNRSDVRRDLFAIDVVVSRKFDSLEDKKINVENVIIYEKDSKKH